VKASTEKMLIAGILVSGVIALWAHQAAASGGGSSAPQDFHPELSALERAYVWNEVQNNTGSMMLGKASIYASTILQDGSHLSPLALAALATEAAQKGAA
jgi:hypothetical protein